MSRSLLITFIQFVFDHIHKVFEKRNDEIAPIPPVVHQEKQRIAAITLRMNSASARVRFVVDFCAYAYETVSFIGRVLSEVNVELQLEVGGHALACLMSCYYSQNKRGCSAKAILLTIVTYPRPVRYAAKYIVGRREQGIVNQELGIVNQELGIVNQEQTDHERCLESLANFCEQYLNCKRTDFIVSLIIFVLMVFLNVYLVLQNCQLDNPATFDLTFTVPILKALTECLLLLLKYRMSEDEYEMVASDTQMRLSEESEV